MRASKSSYLVAPSPRPSAAVLCVAARRGLTRQSVKLMINADVADARRIDPAGAREDAHVSFDRAVGCGRHVVDCRRARQRVRPRVWTATDGRRGGGAGGLYGSHPLLS